MSNELPQTGSALDNAVVYAEQILDTYPDNTRFLVLTNDFAPFSNFPKSREAVREILTELTYSPIPRTLSEVLGRFSARSPSAISREDIYFISDFQSSTLGPATGLHADSSYRYYLVPMEYTSTSNVFFDSVYLETPFLLAGEKNALNAIVRNAGTTEASDVIFKLFVEDLQVASGSATIPAGGTETISFPLGTEAADITNTSRQGRISFEEFPVTFDNDFYFSLDMTDQVRIVELNESDNSPFEAVFGNENLFNFSSFDVSNVDYNELYSADLVIIYKPEALSDGLVTSLSNYRDQGGTLLIVPGPQSPPSQVASLAANSPFTRYGADRRMELSSPDLGNPFYSNIFEGRNRRFDMPEATPVLNLGAAGNKLLSFKNQDTFLSMIETESGKVFVTAGPFSEDYSDFRRHALFVPIMYRIASLSKNDSKKLYYSLTERNVIIPMDSIGAEDIIRLQNQDDELVPAQQFTNGRLVLDLPRFSMTPGYYNLTLRDSTLRVLAFNNSPVESYLDQATATEVASGFFNGTNVEIFVPEDAQAFRKALEARFDGLPLWKYALGLAVIFLLVEIALIRLL
ncbi:hypothetical protein AB9P05_03525 [Roseivirga sp. BDSF3-8]|uniref:hypothetical protein n=1 Tax=Roseivirga sp. BDSF3-8 TaxID=3241598 RepID=UPI003531F840